MADTNIMENNPSNLFEEQAPASQPQMDELDAEKYRERLRASYQMYEKTIVETRDNMTKAVNANNVRKYSDAQIEDRLKLLREAQHGVLEEYLMAGGNADDIKKEILSSEGGKDSSIENILLNGNSNPQPVVNKKKNEDEIEKILAENESTGTRTKIVSMAESMVPKSDGSPRALFDVIPLPSKGEGYADKKSTLPVAYLTAYDENMIASPNLYHDKKILDMLVEQKVLNHSFDTLDLLEGDRDAVILFLRASGYGNEYPITVRDDKTGIPFEAVVDLSKLEYKDFSLKGDANGWFEYKLPVSGSIVKFRFPTHRDILTLEKLENKENKGEMRARILDSVETLTSFLENDKDTPKDILGKATVAVQSLKAWGESITPSADEFGHAITNRLALLIMSVDDVTDKKYIYDFVKGMNVRDSASLRRYITKNEPGIDYNITVDKPESLGGGSMEVFLQFDEFIFLDIPE